jgi:hypothetical protein
MLGILDIVDTSHPVFKAPYTEAVMDLASSDGSKEQSEASHVEDTGDADLDDHVASSTIALTDVAHSISTQCRLTRLRFAKSFHWRIR